MTCNAYIGINLTYKHSPSRISSINFIIQGLIWLYSTSIEFWTSHPGFHYLQPHRSCFTSSKQVLANKNSITILHSLQIMGIQSKSNEKVESLIAWECFIMSDNHIINFFFYKAVISLYVFGYCPHELILNP